MAFRNQYVANLAWCIRSAPLLKANAIQGAHVLSHEWCEEQYKLHSEWLAQLDADPSELIDTMDAGDSKHPRLGKRFEMYIGFWLKNSPHFNLRARNIQIKNEQFTVGEFDFIIDDLEADETVHLEIACKYYLSAQNVSGHKHWVGPSGRDRLDLKVETLKRQVQLSETAEGSRYLKNQGIHVTQKAVFMKGFFFFHFKTLMQFKSPLHAHPKHHAGWWARETEVNELFKGDGTWAILPKSEWLAVNHSGFTDESLFSARKMPTICRDYIAEHGRAVMVAQLDYQDGVWVEMSRGCIVNRAWPHSL